MNARMILPLALLVAACETEDTDDGTPDAACVETAGGICTWLGIPSTAMFSAEGLDRLETATYLPMDGTYGPDGRFYFIDFNNHRIRRVEADDTVTTIAGSGFLGDGPEGDAHLFAFNHPTDLAFHPLDDNKLYVSAWHNSRINVIDLSTGLVNFECATGARDFGGDGGPAKESKLDLPASVVFEPDGTFYIMDQANQVIRKVDAANVISTFAGKVETRTIDADGDPSTEGTREKTAGWPGYGGDGGPATEARFHAAVGQAADPSSRIAEHDGKIYIADTMNHLIRVIDIASGTVDRFAGQVFEGVWDHDQLPSTPEINELKGWPAYAGDGGDRLDAQFNSPRDIEVDADGNVFVADTENHCVRKIDTAGVVTTVAGTCGVPGFDGDGGPATAAKLFKPYGIELTPDGDLIVADSGNHIFRKVILD